MMFFNALAVAGIVLWCAAYLAARHTVKKDPLLQMINVTPTTLVPLWLDGCLLVGILWLAFG